MDDILLNETQKVRAAREEPEFFDSDYDTKNLYQVDKISLEDTKKKLYWRKCAFEYEQNNSYGIENRNDMTRIHNNKVNNISECNLLHDIINHTKHAKILNNHYSPILHVCINTRKVKEKFKKFRILLDSGCSSTIVMVRLVLKNSPRRRFSDSMAHASRKYHY